jgi:hypothetical protein
MSPRPKGSRNKSTLERETQQQSETVQENTPEQRAIIASRRSTGKPESAKAVAEVIKRKRRAKAVIETVIAPQQPQDPVLVAIQGLASRFDNFEQRLSNVENGHSNPVTGENTNQPRPVMPHPTMNSTTVIDNTSPLPKHDPNQMEYIKREADSITRSVGLDKVQATNPVYDGRPAIKGRYDIRCRVCQKFPVSAEQGGRGVFPSDLSQDGSWCCENCIGK